MTLTVLKEQEPIVLPGARVVCKIDGRHVNNDLYTSLQDKVARMELKSYLMNKYGWTAAILELIRWEAHGKELYQYPYLKRVILIKYLHGWLATNKQCSHEGISKDTSCLLCSLEDTRQHMFQCKHGQMIRLRIIRWKQYMQDVRETTKEGCRQVFTSGLMTINGSPPPPERHNREWPPELIEAYTAQEDIEWIYIFYGRIAKAWEFCAIDHWDKDGGTISLSGHRK